MEIQPEPQLMSERDRVLYEHVQKIREQHAEFLSSARTIGSSLLAAANHRRELGVRLQSLKDAEYATDGESRKVIAHGAWEGLFSDHGNKSQTAFAFTAQTARNYIEFARKHPEEILDLAQISKSSHDLLLDAGEIEAGTREGRSQSSQPEGQAWLSGLLKAWEGLTGRFEKKPLETWPEIQRTTLKEKLKPMVELYARL